jgi:hypothetical protein
VVREAPDAPTAETVGLNPIERAVGDDVPHGARFKRWELRMKGGLALDHGTGTEKKPV